MNDGLKERNRAKIRQVLASHPGVERAVLFGSRATGTYRPGSDVDLALAGDGLTHTDLGAIGAAMEATTVPQMVDLVLWSSVGGVLADHIRTFGVEFYVRE
ncbi:MAG: nucleotidyltransferase domain-containing protein [Caldilineaceae bacterium SB0662_bin_9]|uniref:Nucleotidyltransferase domain-containing protein n=1 Tax=Caldilineaceae bacterium SB0662_bin_9 TaxID=2605258 RepID=A0A6B1DP33_9CHLR|nr:nucleotidyltransferase domain-containing protein [Caldilineaceae bacterium SB0662_bin_9]